MENRYEECPVCLESKPLVKSLCKPLHICTSPPRLFDLSASSIGKKEASEYAVI